MERIETDSPAHPDERLGLEVRASVFLMSAAVALLLVATLLGSAIS